MILAEEETHGTSMDSSADFDSFTQGEFEADRQMEWELDTEDEVLQQ